MSNKLLDDVQPKLAPLVATFEGGRFHATATCHTCNKTTTWSSAKMPAPDIVRKKIRDRHWRLAKVATCATCVQAERKARQKPTEPEPTTMEEAFDREVKQAGSKELAMMSVGVRIDQPPVSVKKADLLSATGSRHVPSARADNLVAHYTKPPVPLQEKPVMSVPTEPARAAKREAYAMLLDHYDADRKRYKGEMSDELISQKTGYAVAAVAKLREDDFGPAGPPPQLLHLKENLGKLEHRIQAEERKLIEGMDALSQLQGNAKQLRTDLDRLVQAHGWEV